jgi:hypothetical protein
MTDWQSQITEGKNAAAGSVEDQSNLPDCAALIFQPARALASG